MANPPLKTGSRTSAMRFSLRTVLFAVAVFGLLLGFVGREVRNAQREQGAYRELVALGATGDDWIGWRELIMGREYAPIVQIGIPPAVSLEKAMPLLSNLDNLESLDVSHRSIHESQFERLIRLKTVRSLNLSSTNLTDAALPHLSRFTHLRRLHLENTKISDDGIRLLERQLPACRIAR